MNDKFVKTSLTILLAATPLTLTYADQIKLANSHNIGKEKNYIVRITSIDQTKHVQIYGSIMNFANSYTNIDHLNGEVTPFDFNYKTTALSTQIMATGDVKVEILERVNNKEKLVESGSGSSIVSFNDTNSVQYVYAR